MLGSLKRFKDKITITIAGIPYLTRWSPFGADKKWGNIHVHHFHSSDQGDELHNHPWEWGVSLILWGGYSEEYLEDGVVKRRERGPGWLNFIRHDHFHRVDLLDEKAGCWTLFIVGPRTGNEWGFWNRHSKQYKHWSENPEAIP